MWEDNNYCWVVLCKNRWSHFRQNLFTSHRIPLGEADGVMPPPPLDGRFRVRCDGCGKEYLYKPSDVRRYEQELPDGFVPHPLFRLEGERRRSKRSLKKLRVVVRGESADNGTFQEDASAISVSDNGALIVLSANELQGQVVRVGQAHGGRAQVGVEFAESSPDFWPAEATLARQ
jgi:hypothetical protein